MAYKVLKKYIQVKHADMRQTNDHFVSLLMKCNSISSRIYGVPATQQMSADSNIEQFKGSCSTNRRPYGGSNSPKGL